MTRQEAIEILKCGRPFDDNPKEDLDDFNLALGVAIKALKQEPILNKIRNEIEAQREEVCKSDPENDDLLLHFYFGLNDGLKDARDILDKYIEESEE